MERQAPWCLPAPSDEHSRLSWGLPWPGVSIPQAPAPDPQQPSATQHAAQPAAPLLLESFRTFFFLLHSSKTCADKTCRSVTASEWKNARVEGLNRQLGEHRSPLQEPAEVTHSQDRSVWSERSVESMELKIPFRTNTLQLKRSHIGKTSNFLGALQILESYFDISLCTYNTLTGGKKPLNSCRTSR